MTQRQTIGAVLIGVAALVASACGAGSDDDITAGTPTENPESAQAEVTGPEFFPGNVEDGEQPTFDQIVTAAEEESGELALMMAYDPDVGQALVDKFNEAYPFASAVFRESKPEDSQAELLELGAGRADFDVMGMRQQAWTQYLPYAMNVDLLSLAEDGTLPNLRAEMINPDIPGIAAMKSAFGGSVYNPERMAEYGVDMDEINTYDDLLDLCEQGVIEPGQVTADVLPRNEAGLVPLLGLDGVTALAEEFVEKCDPTFFEGGTERYVEIAAGEYAIDFVGQVNSAVRVQQDQPGAIEIKYLEPTPIRIGDLQAIRADTDRPNQAVLMMDFLASPEAQQVLDEMGPEMSSFLVEGTNNYDVVQQFDADGHEYSILDWKDLATHEDHLRDIQEAEGFPTAG